jgi:hypothetical protein
MERSSRGTSSFPGKRRGSAGGQSNRDDDAHENQFADVLEAEAQLSKTTSTITSTTGTSGKGMYQCEGCGNIFHHRHFVKADRLHLLGVGQDCPQRQCEECAIELLAGGQQEHIEEARRLLFCTLKAQRETRRSKEYMLAAQEMRTPSPDVSHTKWTKRRKDQAMNLVHAFRST